MHWPAPCEVCRGPRKISIHLRAVRGDVGGLFREGGFVLRIEYFASGRGEGPAAGWGGRRRRWRTHIVVLLGVGACRVAHADPSIVLPNGLPVQVVPTFQEPGLPAFSFPDGSGLAVGGSGSGSDSGSGSGDGASGEAYDTMMAQAWGNQAVDAANAMGVNGAALAATCVMELNCQNVGAVGQGAAGVFQMISSTYTADINGALAYDPSIAGNIVSGSCGTDGSGHGSLCGGVRVTARRSVVAGEWHKQSDSS